MVGIEPLLKELKDNEQKDFEGDLCYRVHIKIAKRLIIESYNRGIAAAQLVAIKNTIQIGESDIGNGIADALDDLLLDT